MAKRTMRKMSPMGDEPVAEYEVGVTSEAEMKKFESEFKAWVKNGGVAADITDQRDVLIDKFDPKADILLIPRVQGGVR